MAAALTLLLIASLLQGSQSKEFKAFMPQTIEVLTASCVTIPCSFEIEDKYESDLDDTCGAKWSNNKTLVFNSKDPQTLLNNGELTGNLRKKDCTTTLNNIQPAGNYTFIFRVECNNGLKWSFAVQTTLLSVKNDPPRPTLTPSALKVEEGASVSLRCSAPAPCLSHPPNVTWTKGLGDIVETLQENRDRTKVLTSVVTFTASHKHHGETISCKASYHKQNGSAESAVSLTADVSYSPKVTTVSVSPSGPVPEGSNVSLTCSSTANPAVKNYTWYRDDGAKETLIGTGQVLTIKASREVSPLLCKAQNDVGVGRSNNTHIDVQVSDQVTLTVSISVVVALLLLVCALLFVIRAQKTHHDHGEGQELPNTAEGPSGSPEKTSEEGKDVVYSTVNWRTSSKKKRAEALEKSPQPGGSYLEEEMCVAGGMLRGFVSNALEMEGLYGNVEPRKLHNKCWEVSSEPDDTGGEFLSQDSAIRSTALNDLSRFPV